VVAWEEKEEVKEMEQGEEEEMGRRNSARKARGFDWAEKSAEICPR